MRWAAAALLLAATAAAALDPPPDCPSAMLQERTERGAVWACGADLYAYTSSARPEHWHDGAAWRAPRLVWERVGAELVFQGAPGPLVYRATEHGLTIGTRDGQPVGRLQYWDALPAVTPDGARLRFALRDLPCELAATKAGPKLACDVAAPRGRYALSIPADGLWVAKDGAAVTAGARLERLHLIGADGNEYHNTVSEWRVFGGRLTAEIDDTGVPAPYVIDPLTGPNFPDTCANDATVGTIAWSSPSNALTSNDTRTTAAVNVSQGETNYLKCTDFDFDAGILDVSKTIKGIIAEAEVSCTGSQCATRFRIEKAKLVRANGTISASGTANRQNLTLWGTSDTQRVIGGSLDTWGGDCDGAVAECLPSDVTDVDFGVAFAAKNVTSATSGTARVDAVRMTIYYSPPAGRIFATGWDTWGLEVPSTAEGWATSDAACSAADTPYDCCTGSGAGTCDLPTVVAAAKRTGTGAASTNRAGLRIDAPANEASFVCYALDADLADKGYARVYLNLTASTLADGESAIILWMGQDDSADTDSDPEVGCYATLTANQGAYELHVRYHGPQATSDLDYGSVALGLGWQAIELGQRISGGDSIACPLRVNGEGVQDSTNQLSVDSACDGICDLSHVCLGSPAPDAVNNYAAFGALALDYDDLAVDNLAAVGIGRVLALYPNAVGATVDWSNTGCSTSYVCLQDWMTGVEETCLGASGRSVRERTGTAATDLFKLDDIHADDMTGADSVQGVRLLNATCENNANTGTLNLAWRQCASDASCASPVDVDGLANAMTQNARRLIQEHRSENLSADGIGAPEVWTETLVNALQVGLDKVGGTGAMRSEAVVLYVDVKSPDPQPDWNLQDWTGDGHLTLLAGCNSFTAGTLNSICSAVGACRATCDADDDCNGGTCVTGRCEMLCEDHADCTCASGATCQQSLKWMNQLTTRVDQLNTLINCGRNTMPHPWWSSVIATVITNPRSLAPPCELVKGAWGHCNDQPTATCDGDASCADCDEPCQSGACNFHLPDYVFEVCGANDYTFFVPHNCNYARSFPPSHFEPPTGSRWGPQACPMAATTPGDYESERLRCDDQGDTAARDAYCVANVGTGSLCLGYCENHQDPVWPCVNETHCGHCAGNTDRWCYHEGACFDNPLDRCDVDGDCASGTCATYESQHGPWGDAFGDGCDTCENNACINTTQYCTIPCGAIACTADADCGFSAGAMGGYCDTGFCKGCGAGFTDSAKATTAAQQLNEARRLNASPGNLMTDQYIQRVLASRATIEAAGARHLAGYYAQTALVGPNRTLFSETMRRNAASLHRLPNVVDIYHAAPYSDSYLFPFTSRYGLLLAGDGLHPGPIGAALFADGLASSLNTLYPACTTNTAVDCGYCDSPCVPGDAQSACSSPAASHTPTASACGAAANTRCQCVSNSDCAPGCRCTDVDDSGATDKRCVCEDVEDCPVGNLTAVRKRVASDDVCVLASAGTCDKEFSPPLCTRSKVRCATTADCNGAARGDVCAAEGVWQKCVNNGECRDGALYADPVCAAATGATDKLCQQPTPTP